MQLWRLMRALAAFCSLRGRGLAAAFLRRRRVQNQISPSPEPYWPILAPLRPALLAGAGAHRPPAGPLCPPQRHGAALPLLGSGTGPPAAAARPISRYRLTKTYVYICYVYIHRYIYIYIYKYINVYYAGAGCPPTPPPPNGTTPPHPRGWCGCGLVLGFRV